MEYLLAARRPREEIIRSFGLKLMSANSKALQTPGILEVWDSDCLFLEDHNLGILYWRIGFLGYTGDTILRSKD